MNVVIFFEFKSIFEDLEKSGLKEIDLELLIDYLADSRDNRNFIIGYSYLEIDEEQHTSMDVVLKELKDSGFITRTKNKGENNGFEVDITVDVFKVLMTGHADIIVIYSKNNKLIPMINEVQSMGLRVEITGTQENELSDVALGFINLTKAYVDYSDAQEVHSITDEQTENKKEE
jgi:uncharacterized LabA/DUF88 family protein